MPNNWKEHQAVIKEFFNREIRDELERDTGFDSSDVENIIEKIEEFLEEVSEGEYRSDRYTGLVPGGEKIAEKIGVEGPNGILVYNPKFKYLSKEKVLTIIYLEILDSELEQLYGLDEELERLVESGESTRKDFRQIRKEYVSWRNKVVLMKRLAEELGESHDMAKLDQLRSRIEDRTELIQEVTEGGRELDTGSRERLENLLEKEERQLTEFQSEVGYEGLGYSSAK